MEQKSKYLKIDKAIGSYGNAETYICSNVLQDEIIGKIIKERVGRFMHWCFEPEADTYFTNGCLKQISAFITKLYSKEDV